MNHLNYREMMDLTGLSETELSILEDSYNSYAIVCECGMRTVLARLENIKQEMENRTGVHSYDIFHRMKPFCGVIEKCHRRGYDYTIEAIKAHVLDIAGIRVVVDFPDDIETVKRAIIRQPSMFVVEEKDYVKNPKSNGYKSLHLNVEMDIYFEETNMRPPVEIQIRDQAMDLWARLEHRIKYKKEAAAPEAIEMFKRAAEMLDRFDASVVKLRNYSTAVEKVDELTNEND